MAAGRCLRLLGDAVKAYYAAVFCDMVWICVGAGASSDLSECRLEHLGLCGGVGVVVHGDGVRVWRGDGGTWWINVGGR